jgi:hypothetical protein
LDFKYYKRTENIPTFSIPWPKYEDIPFGNSAPVNSLEPFHIDCCLAESIPTGVRLRKDIWFIFNPKIPIWVNFEGLWNGEYWYVFWSFGKFLGHLVYFMANW